MLTLIKIFIIGVLLVAFVAYIAKAVMHAKAAGENLKEIFRKKDTDEDSSAD